MNYNVSEIDTGIRSLVGTINKIPFVETWMSCEGHIEKLDRRKLEEIAKVLGGEVSKPNEIYYVSAGLLDFFVDGTLDVKNPYEPKVDNFRHAIAGDFVKRVENLSNKYNYVKFGLLQPAPFISGDIRPNYDFRVWGECYRVSNDEVMNRKKQVNEVWRELENLCVEFSSESKSSLQKN